VTASGLGFGGGGRGNYWGGSDRNVYYHSVAFPARTAWEQGSKTENMIDESNHKTGNVLKVTTRQATYV